MATADALRETADALRAGKEVAEREAEEGRAALARMHARADAAELKAQRLGEALVPPPPPPPPPPPLPSRTDWTRLVPPLVLTGHAPRSLLLPLPSPLPQS